MQKKAIIAIVVVVIVALVGIKLLAYWSRQAAERAQEQAAFTETTTTATPIEVTMPAAPVTEAAPMASTESAVSQEAVSMQAQPTVEAQSISLLPHDVQEVQIALKNAGFDPGSVDGKLGRRTKAAIRDFQTANSLNPDGKVGPKTWSKLSRFLTQGTSVEQPAEKLN